MPAELYAIGLDDADALAACVPTVRARILASLGYPELFRNARDTSMTLPSTDAVAHMQGDELREFWSSMADAQRRTEEPTPTTTADQPSPRGTDAPPRVVASGDHLKMFDAAYKHEHTSLMSKHLTRELYGSLEGERTSVSGYALDQIIRPGLDHPQTEIGCIAADADAYDRFHPLLSRVVDVYHGSSSTRQVNDTRPREPVRRRGDGLRATDGRAPMRQGKVAAHRSDVDAAKLELPRGLELAETRVTLVASRNFAELPFPPAMNAEQQAEVMRARVCVCARLRLGPRIMRGARPTRTARSVTYDP